MKKYSITDEKEQTIVKHLFDACNKEMSQEEFEVVQMINKLRTEPAAFVKEFIQYAKLMKKEDNVFAFNKLMEISKSLKDRDGVNELEISAGLCFTADYILREAFETKTSLRNKNENNLSVIASKFCKSHKGLFQICDEGDLYEIIQRIHISAYDSNEKYKENLVSNEYIFIGFATLEFEDFLRSCIVLAKSIEEFPDGIWTETTTEEIRTVEKIDFNDNIEENVEEISGPELDSIDLINLVRVKTKESEPKLKEIIDILERENVNSNLVVINRLQEYINSLPLKKKCPQDVELSVGLFFTADSILNKIAESKDPIFKPAKDEDIKEILESYLETFGKNIQIFYFQYDIEQSIARILTSKLDTNNNYEILLHNKSFKHIGIRSKRYGTIVRNVMILADEVQELDDNRVHEEIEIEKIEKITTEKKKEFKFNINKGEFSNIKPLEKILKFRTQPDELEKDFIELSKQWKSYNTFKSKGEEVEKFNVKNRKCLDGFVVLEGLSAAALEICGISKDEDTVRNFEKLELKTIVSKYVRSFRNLNHIIDDGNSDKFIPRCLFSELDKARVIEKLFMNESVKYIGFASIQLHDGDERSCLIFAEECEDFLNNDLRCNHMQNLSNNALSATIKVTNKMIVSDGERNIINEFNRFRTRPQSFEGMFKNWGKMLKKMNKPTGDEIIKIAEELGSRESCPRLVISLGLCKAAAELLREKDHDKKFIKADSEELNLILEDHLNQYENVFEMLDQGPIQSIVPRSMISDFDENKEYSKAIANKIYKYIGFATCTTLEEDQLSVILLAKDVEELDDYKRLAEDEINIAFEMEKNDEIENLKLAKQESSEVNNYVERVKEEEIIEDCTNLDSNIVPDNNQEFILETINKLRVFPKYFCDVFQKYGKWAKSKNSGEADLLISYCKELLMRRDLPELIYSKSLSNVARDLSKGGDLDSLLEKNLRLNRGVDFIKDKFRLSQFLFKLVKYIEKIESEENQFIGFYCNPPINEEYNGERDVVIVLGEDIEEFSEKELNLLEVQKIYPINDVDIYGTLEKFRLDTTSFEKNFNSYSDYLLKINENESKILNLENILGEIKNRQGIKLKIKKSPGLNDLAAEILKKKENTVNFDNTTSNLNNNFYNSLSEEEKNKLNNLFLRRVKKIRVIEFQGRLDFLVPKLLLDNNYKTKETLFDGNYDFVGFSSIDEDPLFGVKKVVIVFGSYVTEKGEPIIEERDQPVKIYSNENILSLLNILRTQPTNELLGKIVASKIESNEKRNLNNDLLKKFINLHKKPKKIKQSKLIFNQALSTLANTILNSPDQAKLLKRDPNDANTEKLYNKLKSDTFKMIKDEQIISDRGRVDYLIPRLIEASKDNLISNLNKRYFGIATKKVGTFSNRKTKDGKEFQSEGDTEEPEHQVILIICDDLIEKVSATQVLKPINTEEEMIDVITEFSKKPSTFSNEIKVMADEVRRTDTGFNKDLFESLCKLSNDLIRLNSKSTGIIVESIGLKKLAKKMLDENLFNCKNEDLPDLKDFKKISSPYVEGFKSVKIFLDTGRYDFFLSRICTARRSFEGEGIENNILLNGNYTHFGFATVEKHKLNNKMCNKRNILILASEVEEIDKYEAVPLKKILSRDQILQQLNQIRTAPNSFNFDLTKEFIIRLKNLNREKVKKLEKSISDLANSSRVSEVQVKDGLDFLAEDILVEINKKDTLKNIEQSLEEILSNEDEMKHRIGKYLKTHKNLKIIPNAGRLDQVIPQLAINKPQEILSKPHKLFGFATTANYDDNLDKSDQLNSKSILIFAEEIEEIPKIDLDKNGSKILKAKKRVKSEKEFKDQLNLNEISNLNQDEFKDLLKKIEDDLDSSTPVEKLLDNVLEDLQNYNKNKDKIEKKFEEARKGIILKIIKKKANKEDFNDLEKQLEELDEIRETLEENKDKFLKEDIIVDSVLNKIAQDILYSDIQDSKNLIENPEVKKILDKNLIESDFIRIVTFEGKFSLPKLLSADVGDNVPKEKKMINVILKKKSPYLGLARNENRVMIVLMKAFKPKLDKKQDVMNDLNFIRADPSILDKDFSRAQKELLLNGQKDKEEALKQIRQNLIPKKTTSNSNNLSLNNTNLISSGKTTSNLSLMTTQTNKLVNLKGDSKGFSSSKNTQALNKKTTNNLANKKTGNLMFSFNSNKTFTTNNLLKVKTITSGNNKEFVTNSSLKQSKTLKSGGSTQNLVKPLKVAEISEELSNKAEEILNLIDPSELTNTKLIEDKKISVEMNVNNEIIHVIPFDEDHGELVPKLIASNKDLLILLRKETVSKMGIAMYKSNSNNIAERQKGVLLVTEKKQIIDSNTSELKKNLTGNLRGVKLKLNLKKGFGQKIMCLEEDLKYTEELEKQEEEKRKAKLLKVNKKEKNLEFKEEENKDQSNLSSFVNNKFEDKKLDPIIEVDNSLELNSKRGLITDQSSVSNLQVQIDDNSATKSNNNEVRFRIYFFMFVLSLIHQIIKFSIRSDPEDDKKKDPIAFADNSNFMFYNDDSYLPSSLIILIFSIISILDTRKKISYYLEIYHQILLLNLSFFYNIICLCFNGFPGTTIGNIAFYLGYLSLFLLDIYKFSYFQHNKVSKIIVIIFGSILIFLTTFVTFIYFESAEYSYVNFMFIKNVWYFIVVAIMKLIIGIGLYFILSWKLSQLKYYDDVYLVDDERNIGVETKEKLLVIKS